MSDVSSEKEVIDQLVAQLGQDGFSDSIVNTLVLSLRQQYPQSDAALRLSEALGLELELERDESEYPWILFSLNDTAYGINSKYVLSIELLGEITPIVDGPHYSPGMTKSRGEMIDLVDLRALFGIGDYQSAKANDPDAFFMMVVAEIDGAKHGLIVDEIIAVEHITNFDDGTSGDRRDITSQYVSYVAKREKSNNTVLVLKPENLVL